MTPIKIMVVDDHELFRLGVCTTLKRDKQIHVVNEFSTGDDFLDYFTKNPDLDILILDVVMPGMSGIEVAKRIKKDYVNTKIILLTSQSDEETIVEAIQIGVEGFLSKLGPIQELTKAIKLIQQGETFFGTEISKIMYGVLLSKNYNNVNKQQNTKDDFSEREIEIITACSEGLTAEQTAKKLFISKRTVEWHRQNIFSKIGINNSVDLVKYALKNRIIEF